MQPSACDALRRALRFAGLGLAVATLLWAAGFALFLATPWRPPGDPPQGAGIVVLTGGAGRVAEGLRLLDADPTSRLLVSGVYHATPLADLVRGEGRDAAALAGRVTLGRAARSTRGNAEETAAWARGEAIDTLVVVTSAYHMPRALLLLRRALPEARLVPRPIAPRGRSEPFGWLSPSELRFAASEYTKWLAALAGVTENPFPSPLRRGLRATAGQTP